MEVKQYNLPSNSSIDKFPNNTLTEYRVGLPQTVSLTGDWDGFNRNSLSARTTGILSKDILAINHSEPRIVRGLGGTNDSTGSLFCH